MGDYNVRHEDAFELSDASEDLILTERNAEVAALRNKADALSKLSAMQYLGRGLHLGHVQNFELAGRLAKSEFSTIEYMWGKPGWRVYSGNSEFYVPKERIAAVFAMPPNSEGVEKP